MKVKGINYDAGTEFRPGETSRPIWNTDDVLRDLRTIRRELHCTSVNIYGTGLTRLEEGATLALQEGLQVSFQRRSIDRNRAGMLQELRESARAAERLRKFGEVTLNTGCELTIFTHGFLPGRSFVSRIRNMVWAWPFLPLVNRRLNRHLREVIGAAREHFGGEITYSAGAWETVNWDGFDRVGVNLYRDRWNEKTYVAGLQSLRRHGKPLLITEFGCCTFEGAERKGGGGWMIVDFNRNPPVLKPGYRRSERVQARVVGELLDIFAAEGVHGAYVFDFMGSGFCYHPDAKLDLDAASYGVVRVLPSAPGERSMRWERKEAFHAVARRYRRCMTTDAAHACHP